MGVLFCERAVGAGLRPKFPLYHTPHFLSREKLHKVLAAKIPKLVQNYHLIFLKNFAIIIIQGKGKIPCEVKKKLQKKLKKLLTNKRKHVIIVIQGKEGQRSQPLKTF